MAKRLIVWILLLGVVVGGYFYAKNTYYSPCDTPITYKLGSLDSRFNISQDELKKDIDMALIIWEKPQGQDLFKYDANGLITVNLVFDERQALNNQIQEQEGALKGDKSALSSQIAQYETQVADFNKRVKALNDSINYWNSKGGAPEDEYNKLLAEQNSLRVEADRLNSLAASLNLKTVNYNAKIGKLNGTIDTFNTGLTAKPEEGIYDSSKNTIDIFFMTNKQELIHTLAHEFGHALGLEHIDDAKAIMYAQASSTVKPTSLELSNLKKICEKRSILEMFSHKLRSFSSLRLASSMGVLAN